MGAHGSPPLVSSVALLRAMSAGGTALLTALGTWPPGLLCGSTRTHVSRGHRLSHCPGHLAPSSPLWLC